MKLGRLRVWKIWLSILAALLLLPTGCAKKKEAKAPYRIGGIFAITGPASFLGEPERNSMLLLAEKINAAGGINGHPLEVIIYDTEGDATKAVLNANKLIEKDKVLAIVGPSRSGTTLAVVPIVEKAQVPLISCAASVKITTPVKKWVFKTPQTDVMAVSKIYDYLKGQGAKKIAILTVSNAFGDSGRQQLLQQAADYGYQIVADERFGPKDTDMTPQLTKIRGLKPEAIICWGTNPGPAVVAKNMKQLGMDIPLYQSHGVASKKFIELAGKASEGIILPTGKILVAGSLPDNDPQKAVLLQYISEYEAKYNSAVSGFGGYAWDGLQILAQALKVSGADRARLRDEIEKITDYVGISGIFRFSPKDHNGLNKDEAFVMVKIVQGNWQIIK
ncbi:MAG: ABC transporter substrate-binding protein [Deltaproteobacteria bacterium]|nr:ABC transporter substrate-binding protein [Deltaproteobacteria bacterium]MBW2070680.1 ABC transporter substrate-binding protein [Deltaproteobacteria bacterium]